MTVSDISRACSNWSIEITPPGSKKIEKFSNFLDKGTSVNITFLPGTDFNDTIATAKRLSEEGMNPIPHISARSIKSLKTLNDMVYKLKDFANVNEVLVIAGGLGNPLGCYYNSMQILETGILQKYEIKKIGVSGHPEGSPDISENKLNKAIIEKNSFAEKEGIKMYIETQFCFNPKTVLVWENKIRKLGNKLPIKVGIPGPATIKSLFRFAQISGIGPSMNFIAKQASNVAKLLTIQKPDILINEISKSMNLDKNCLIENFHFYPFGGFEKTVKYADALNKNKFQVLSNGNLLIKD